MFLHIMDQLLCRITIHVCGAVLQLFLSDLGVNWRLATEPIIDKFIGHNAKDSVFCVHNEAFVAL